MNSMAQYSDIELKQAKLMSHLSGRPAQVRDDVFVWNGYLLDRACATVALLKVYSSLPVTTAAKDKLCTAYYKRFEHEDSGFIINKENSDWNVDIWFYKICKRIKGKVETRQESEIKQILIDLHKTN